MQDSHSEGLGMTKPKMTLQVVTTRSRNVINRFSVYLVLVHRFHAMTQRLQMFLQGLQIGRLYCQVILVDHCTVGCELWFQMLHEQDKAPVLSGYHLSCTCDRSTRFM